MWPIHSQGPSKQKLIKNFEENWAWAYPRTVQCFYVLPIISGTVKGTDFKFGGYRFHPNKSQLKFWRKGDVGVSKDCPNFKVPPYISGTGKATKFKLCAHIHGIDRNKSPLKLSGKASVGVLRDSRNFSGHPYIGRIGHICGRSAFLLRFS